MHQNNLHFYRYADTYTITKIVKLLDLTELHGFDMDYLTLPGQMPKRFREKEDIEKFNLHSNAIKELLEAKLTTIEAIGITKELITETAEAYCRKNFGIGDDGRKHSSDYIHDLAFRLSLPFYQTMETKIKIAGQYLTQKQINAAFSKLKAEKT